ncbi:MAG: hypothetical protein LQ347_004386, partial [Umbilicaria vellea]
MQASWKYYSLQSSQLGRHFIHTPQRMERTYSDAVAALNTVQSNYAVISAIRASSRSLNKQSIPEMIEWCHKIGYE